MKYQDNNMIFMPINLNLANREVLVVGGGNVALQKIIRILDYTSNIRVVAREVCEEIKRLEISFTEKAYEKSDLGASYLVYACTNSILINQQVCDDATEERIMVNNADNPPISDFVSPATYKNDNMTVSVGSNGQDVKKAIRWRNKIKRFLENSTED